MVLPNQVAPLLQISELIRGILATSYSFLCKTDIIVFPELPVATC